MNPSRLILTLLVVHVATASVIFANPFAPIMIAAFFTDRIGLPHWHWLVVGAIGLAAALGWIAWRAFKSAHFAVALFSAASLIIAVVVVGTQSTALRKDATARLSPDRIMTNSFAASLRNAPREFQFFLHAAALKDCKPYAWSYRTMSFYELPPNIAVNVLPVDWVRDCAIVRVPN